jgi:hypothetical protein
VVEELRIFQVPDIILSVVLWIQQELLTESRLVPNMELRDRKLPNKLM